MIKKWDTFNSKGLRQFLSSHNLSYESETSLFKLKSYFGGLEVVRVDKNQYQQTVLALLKYEGLQRWKKIEPTNFRHLEVKAQRLQVHIDQTVDSYDIEQLFEVIQAQRQLLILDKTTTVRGKIADFIYCREFYEFQLYRLFKQEKLTKKQLYIGLTIIRTEQRDKLKQRQLRNFELKNIEIALLNTTFDGFHFISETAAENDLKVVASDYSHYEEKTERQFDSGKDTDFVFNFQNNTEFWEEQFLQFSSSRRLFSYLSEQDEAKKWKKLRGSTKQKTNTFIGTAVYMCFLKKDAPKTYQYLLDCKFDRPCHNVWDYIKECKSFTSHLKYNFSALEQIGVDPILIFELEQLAGFRIKQKELDWDEQVGDWISEKKSNNTAMAAYATKMMLNAQTKDEIADYQFDWEVVYNSATYNSPGTAKGEKIDNTYLRNQGFRVPKTVPASKTAFNLTATQETRMNLIRNKGPLFGYLIDKEEVTKVRGVVNTDLKSHYKMAPLEKLMIKLLKGDGIFNFLSNNEQAEIQKDWITRPKLKLCMDQSSYDHYVSAHSLVQILAHYASHTTPSSQIRTIIEELNEDFKKTRIAMVSEKRQTIWKSGLLSGWKITSIGGSTCNKAQTAYCMLVHGQQQKDYWITVLGDDVVMNTNGTVSAKQLAFTMNANRLVQHPDKTISSSRFNEFLRILYDSKLKKIRGYPTRLIPSLIYRKPWIGSYDMLENDYGGIVSRLKNWASLGSRMGTKATSHIAAAIDIAAITNRASTSELKELIFKLSHEQYTILVKPEWRTLTRKDKAMQRPPQHIDIVNGNIKSKDVERAVYIWSNEKFFGKIDAIKEFGAEELIPYSTLTMSKRYKPLPSLPFPKTWVNKLIRTMKNSKFVKLSITYGIPYWQLSVKIKQVYQDALSRPGEVVKDYKKMLAMKSDQVFFTKQPDNFINILKDRVFQTVLEENLDIRNSTERLTLLLIKQDWDAFVFDTYGTKHIQI